jgi:hypothetical protein
MLDELIGPANADDRRLDSRVVQVLDHRAAEAVVQDVVLDRAEHLDRAGEELDRPRRRAA